MEKITVLFEDDYMGAVPVTYLCISGITAENFKKTLIRAAKLAGEDSFKGKLSDIPNKYLEQVGLVRYSDMYPVVHIQNEPIRTKEELALEKAGLYTPSCFDCNGYEYGYCQKYGSVSPYDTDIKGCIHSPDVFLITDPETEGTRCFTINVDELRKYESSTVPKDSDLNTKVALILGINSDYIQVEETDTGLSYIS